jgi:hypothetical protein
MKRYRWHPNAFILPTVFGMFLGGAEYLKQIANPLWWIVLLMAALVLVLLVYEATTGKLRVERAAYRIAQWRREDEEMSAKLASKKEKEIDESNQNK